MRRGALPPSEKTFLGGTRDRMHLVEPDSLVEYPDRLVLNGTRHVRMFYIEDWPEYVDLGWFYGAFSRRADVDLAFYVDPASPEKVVRDLNHRITLLQTQILQDEKRGYVANLRLLREALAEHEELRHAIQTRRNRMFFVSAVIGVSSEDREELERACRSLVETLNGQGIRIRPATLRQLPAFQALLPGGREWFSAGYRNMDLGATSTCWPVIWSELSHPGGVYLGRTETGSPVVVDLHQGPPLLENQHLGVFATPGSGKTTLVKVLLARSAVVGIQTAVIDPEGEYWRLADYVDAVVVRLQPDRSAGINPLDVRPDARDDGTPYVNLPQKILDVRELIERMAEWNGVALSVAERDAVDRATAELYRRRGISEDPESLFERAGAGDGVVHVGRARKAMPTLHDLLLALESRPGGELVAKMLRQYTREGPIAFLDGPSDDALLEAPLVVFDISRLDERTMRPLAMYAVLGWLWETFVKGRPGLKQVVVDEAWMLAQQPDTARFLESMALRARKRSTSLVVCTQRFQYFARDEAGRSVLNSLASTVLMRQNANDVPAVREAFRLSDGQAEALLTLGVGEALIRCGGAGRDAVRFYVDLFDFERGMLEQPTTSRALAVEGQAKVE